MADGSNPARSAVPHVNGSVAGDERHVPTCFVLEEESSVRHFVSLILQGAGVDTEEFADSEALHRAMERREPDLVFHNVGADTAEAIDSLMRLAIGHYGGTVQLISSRGPP